MKLDLSRNPGQNAFTGYGEGYVLVNGVRYEGGLVVTPDGPVQAWKVTELEALQEDQVVALAGLEVEILLLGTGSALRFPPARLLQSLYRAGIGVEIMDTQAACRTYNILMAEGRKVAAALII